MKGELEMIGSMRKETVTQAAYHNMANFSVQARAIEFANSKNALDSAQNNLLSQLLNKESELTREMAKG